MALSTAWESDRDLLLAQYDTNHNGVIDKPEVIATLDQRDGSD